MPPHFNYPSESTDFWIASADPAVSSVVEFERYRDRNYWVTLRLAPGVTVDKVQALLNTIQARQIKEFALANEGWELQLRKVTDLFVDSEIQRSLWILASICGIVWLIACVNLATLTITRGESRLREFAIRGALGAQRRQIIGQTFSECLLLSTVGGVLGLAVTNWGMDALATYMGGVRLRPIEVDVLVLVLSLVTGLVTSVVFGLIPSLYFSQVNSLPILKVSANGATSSRNTRLLSRGLIISQIALTVVVLVGAGLMVRSVLKLLAVDPGYRVERLFRVDVRLPMRKYIALDHPSEEISRVVERLHQRISLVSGVEGTGVLVSSSGSWDHVAVGKEHSSLEIAKRGCGVGVMNPFTVLGAPLLAGRFLDSTDIELNAVVVNRSLAERFWRGVTNALGQRFRGAPGGRFYQQVWEVVGVVEDIRINAYDELVRPTMYRLGEEYYHKFQDPVFWVRSDVDLSAMINSICESLKSIEPDINAVNVTRIKEELYEQTSRRRTYTFYLILLSGVGVVLAAIGLFGLMANNAARQMREMGIRAALGASQFSLGRTFIFEGICLSLTGGILGLLCATATGRFLKSQLFGIAHSDPLTMCGVLLLVMLIGIVSALIPARRASIVDPLETLRDD